MAQPNDNNNGNKGDDIKGSAENDVLTGTDKNNKIEGEDGNDVINGLDGDDHLKGGDGDDSLYGGAGKDHLEGNDGDDFLDGGDGADKLHGKDGDDTIEGGAGDDDLHGEDGNDTLSGDDGADKLEGGNGNDVLEGGRGEDHVKGGDGDDEIIWNAGDGEDKIDGGKGEDTFTLNSSDIVAQTILLSVNERGDLVVSLDGDSEGAELELKNIENFNLQIGAAGATLNLGALPGGSISAEPLKLSGGDGGDVVDAGGSQQAVVVDAGAGDDQVTGSEAADIIGGGEGADIITGGGGDDIIDAGTGDDVVVWEAGDGNDEINGGDGDDSVDVTLHDTQSSVVSISSDAAGNVVLTADDGTKLVLDQVEEIVIKAGAAGTTITIGDLTGTDISNNTLYFVGGIGNDNFDASITDRRIVATGGAGNDVLLSGTGNDMLDGGSGNDTLNAGGGSGVDRVLGGDGDDKIITTLGDDFDGFAVDIIDGGADEDQLDIIFIEPTNYDLFFTVSSNGDGSFRVSSNDSNINERVDVSNVESLRLVFSEGALNVALSTLSDTSLAANGVSFAGSPDADFLDGSNTDVVIAGSGAAGDDNIIGGSQNDYLLGGDGDDNLSGNAGDDILIGEAGNDILDGGDGYDKADYSGAAAGVTVDLGTALQQNTGSAGLDTLVNIEEVIGSDHADVLSSGAANDVLRGGAGNDQLSGGAGFDRLYGGDGDDSLSDPGTLDPLSGDAGNDFIDGVASYYNDPAAVIANFSDADVTVGGETVAARTARDGYGDTDTFGAATRNLQGSKFSDHVTGSDVGQGFYSRDGDDQLFGLGGNDIFRGGRGNDTIDGGDGYDFADYRDDTVDGAPTQGININLLTGAATDGFGDSDSLISIEGIHGTSLGDTIVGDANNNTLLGQGGDDSLDGGAGDDDLSGGIGNDTLTGGAGIDTYRFDTFTDVAGTDFGHDTINDFDLAEDVLDVASLGIGSLTGLKSFASESNGNTVITIDADRSITLLGVSISGLNASNFIFDDAGTLEGTAGDDNFTGTEALDFYRGLAGNDIISGLGSGDFLFGDEGSDQIFGGDGDDQLYGGADDDFLDGGAGNDRLDGGDGSDRVSYNLEGSGVTVNLAGGTATDGTGGTDTLIGIEHISGSRFSDTLTGDDGPNFILADGGTNSATLGQPDTIYGLGGDDKIFPGGSADIIDGGDGTDIVYFWNEGISSVVGSGITITFQGDGSIHMFNPATGVNETSITNVEAVVGTLGIDTITGNDQDNIIRGFFGADILDGGPGSDTAWYFSGGARTINLAAGTAYQTLLSPFWDTDTLTNFENVVASSADDVLIGDGGDNILEGANGNDRFIGGAGNDFLNGGQSTIISDIGSDDPAVNGWDVVDYSDSPAAVSVNLATGQAADGWGGNDTLHQIDAVVGSRFSDTLIGDANDNAFEGLDGNDTYTTGGGSDAVVISDDASDNVNIGLDTVTDFDVLNDLIDVRALGSIDDMSQLAISQDGADTLITFDAANILRLTNVTAAALTAANFEFAVDQVIVGTANNDVLNGGYGDDTIDGLAGNDQLFGNDGDDVINGGPGSDNLYGGKGNDTLDGGGDFDNIYGEGGDDILNSGGNGNLYGGDGNDTLTGTGNGSKLSGTLNGGPGNDILIEPSGRMLLFGGQGNDTLDGQVSYRDDPAGVFVNLTAVAWDVFGNGSKIVAGRTAIDGWGDTDTLAAGVINVEYSNFSDYVQGDDFAQNFNLLAGDDTAFGGAGNNNFNPGSGNDTIYGSNEWDHLSYWDHPLDTAGASVKGVVVNVSGTDFDYGTGIALANTVEDSYGDTDRVFNIDGVSGTDFDDVMVGATYHNNFYGQGGNDKLFGGDVSNDWLTGGAGDDLIDGQGGEGDTAAYWDAEHGVNIDLSQGMALDDGHGNVDTLVNIENIEGSQYDDRIIGDANRNYIYAQGGNDYIEAGAGDDTLSNREGDDQLFGQAGNDYFEAGSGDNLLDGGDGRDTASYAAWRGTTSGINVNLTVIDNTAPYAGVSSTPNGFGGTDYLRSIENIYGTDYADTLIGDSNDNLFQGYVGNDFLSGGAGDDQLFGADDHDTLDGGAGNDVLDGGENDDNLTGGSGNDRFTFSRIHYGPNGAERVGFGDDIINDFSVTEDTLNVRDVPEFTSVSAMLSHVTSAPGAPDLVLEFISTDNVAGIPELNKLTLVGITPADLANMNIWFAPIVIVGGPGDDVLNGSPDRDTMEGLGGNDVISGAAGDDNLFGGDGDDQLFGEDGHDWLTGGRGNDLIDGGAEFDHVNFDTDGTVTGVNVDLSAAPVDAGGYTGVIVVSNDGTGGTDYLRNVSNITGTNFNDILTGAAGHNYLEGRDGDDVLHGGDDNDNLEGGRGNDQLFGDDGNDWFAGREGDDLIDGGAGHDFVHYDNNNATTTGVTIDLSGLPVDQGGYTGVFVVANDGSGGTDYLRSIEGISGTAFSDSLTGGGEDNNFIGNAGDDVLIGGAGVDWLSGGSGSDLLDGGAGVNDTASFWDFNGIGGVVVDLTAATVSAGGYSDVIVVGDDGNGGTDYLRGIEYLNGTKFGDTLTGGAGRNVLHGNEGDDTLNGGADNDYLHGGEGNDTLIAGGNNDYLVGGAGNDVFVLSDGMSLTIEDFTAGAGTGDVINLASVAALADFASVLAAAAAINGHVQIDLDGGAPDGNNVVHLIGIASTANLNADDFSF